MSDADYDLKRCAKCAAWIPSTATMCAYCNTSSPDAPPSRPPGSPLSLRHGFRVTHAIIAVNVAYFVFSLAIQYGHTPQGNPGRWAITGGGFHEGLLASGAYEHWFVVRAGQWWRVVAATFLHVGGIHLLLNMLALKQLGDLAETLFGPARFLTVYVVSGVCSTLAVSAWYAGVRGLPDEAIPGLAGASGAIFGVAGLLVVYLLRAGTERGRAIGFAIGRSVLMMLVIGLLVPRLISQVGHVGGLLPGLAFGMTLRSGFADRVRNARKSSAWPFVAALCVAAVALALGWGAWFALKTLETH